jgi:broad-specificity NMP kinase
VTRDGDVVLAELLGLPGSGKSTVARALAATGAVMVRSRYRSWGQVPAYVRSAVRLAPTLATAPRSRSSWRNGRRLLRLASSEAIVNRSSSDPGVTALVFDQGPIFLLRQISDGAAGSVAESRARYLRLWADTLDLVVVLDAPDDALLERIRSREKEHQLKEIGLDEARRGLAAERCAQQAVLDELAFAGPVKIRTIDTSNAGVDDTVTAVRRCIDEIASPAAQA